MWLALLDLVAFFLNKKLLSRFVCDDVKNSLDIIIKYTILYMMYVNFCTVKACNFSSAVVLNHKFYKQ